MVNRFSAFDGVGGVYVGYPPENPTDKTGYILHGQLKTRFVIGGGIDGFVARVVYYRKTGLTDTLEEIAKDLYDKADLIVASLRTQHRIPTVPDGVFWPNGINVSIEHASLPAFTHRREVSNNVYQYTKQTYRVLVVDIPCIIYRV